MTLSKYGLLAWAKSRILFLEKYENAGVGLDIENCTHDQVVGQIMALSGLVEGIQRGNFDHED